MSDPIDRPLNYIGDEILSNEKIQDTVSRGLMTTVLRLGFIFGCLTVL